MERSLVEHNTLIKNRREIPPRFWRGSQSKSGILKPVLVLKLTTEANLQKIPHWRKFAEHLNIRNQIAKSRLKRD
jgi:hypothetical protein